MKQPYIKITRKGKPDGPAIIIRRKPAGPQLRPARPGSTDVGYLVIAKTGKKRG